jgi:mRNA-degrading endonuclease RelE of RelBE toxin-antitoxin system
MELVFSIMADTQLRELPSVISNRIVLKLEWYVSQPKPLCFAKPLVGSPGQFRFRIGEYRAIVSPEGVILLIVRIQKRSEVYRKK